MSDYYRPLSRGVIRQRSQGPIVAYQILTGPQLPDRELELHAIEICDDRFHDRLELREGYESLEPALRRIWGELAPGSRMIAHGGNKLELRIILAGLADRKGWAIRVFVNNQTELRAAAITRNKKTIWFLDSKAILGLESDRDRFTTDFAGRAKKDLRGYYRALISAERSVLAIAGSPMQPTIGSLAIRAFVRGMPPGVFISALPDSLYDIVRNVVVRGGWVAHRRYRGPLYSYDIVSAYAAAMRDCALPWGKGAIVRCEQKKLPGIYLCRLRRSEAPALPFPIRTIEPPHKMQHATGKGEQTWLTTIEIRALRALGWEIEIEHGFCWPKTFRMERWVHQLEIARRRRSGGRAIVVKQIGNNAYGKMLQGTQEYTYCLAQHQPKDALPVCDEEGEIYPGIWMVRETRDTRRCYMRPQIAAFVTAHVRCRLYRIASEYADYFIRADTDSLSFSRPIPLPIAPRYGFWQLEIADQDGIVVANKVYYTRRKKAAAGYRNLDSLTKKEYEKWLETNTPPTNAGPMLRAWTKHLGPAWY